MIVDLRIFIACLGQTWFIDVSFGLESLSMRCLIIGLWYIAYLRGYSDGDTTEKGHAYLTTMCTQCQGDTESIHGGKTYNTHKCEQKC